MEMGSYFNVSKHPAMVALVLNQSITYLKPVTNAHDVAKYMSAT